MILRTGNMAPPDGPYCPATAWLQMTALMAEAVHNPLLKRHLTVSQVMPSAELRWRRGKRWQWILAPASIAVASRLYSILLLLPYVNSPPQRLPLLTSYPSPFLAWDGQWYLHIALLGYHATPLQSSVLAGGHHDFAFYPGWPSLINIASLGGLLPVDVVAAVLANILFVLAAIVVYRLFADRFGARTALWGTVLLAFSPVSYVFSMAYSEAGFLLLVGLYFLDRYGRLSPVLAGLAMLFRVAGVAIAVSAAVMFFLHRDLRWRLILIGAAIATVFAGWWFFIWQLTGSIGGWFEGSSSWSKYLGVVAIGRAFIDEPWHELFWFGFTLLMIVGSLVLIRRHTDLAVYGLVAVSLGLIDGSAPSMARYSLAAFPAFAAFAERLGPRGSLVAAIVFAVVEALFVGLAFGPGPHSP